MLLGKIGNFEVDLSIPPSGFMFSRKYFEGGTQTGKKYVSHVVKIDK